MKQCWEGFIAFLGTNDLDETHRFYHEVLGLPLYKDQGWCRIYNVPGGGRLGFCTHLTVLQGEKAPLLTLLTPEVDNAWNNLKEAGMEPETPREKPEFKIYHFFVKDPSGYCVEIQKFL